MNNRPSPSKIEKGVHCIEGDNFVQQLTLMTTVTSSYCYDSLQISCLQGNRKLWWMYKTRVYIDIVN